VEQLIEGARVEVALKCLSVGVAVGARDRVVEYVSVCAADSVEGLMVPEQDMAALRLRDRDGDVTVWVGPGGVRRSVFCHVPDSEGLHVLVPGPRGDRDSVSVTVQCLTVGVRVTLDGVSRRDSVRVRDGPVCEKVLVGASVWLCVPLALWVATGDGVGVLDTVRGCDADWEAV